MTAPLPPTAVVVTPPPAVPQPPLAPPPAPMANPEYRLDMLEGGLKETDAKLDALTLKIPEQFASAITNQAGFYTSSVWIIGTVITLITVTIAIQNHFGWKKTEKSIDARVAEKIDDAVKEKVTNKITQIENDFAELRSKQEKEHADMLAKVDADKADMLAKVDANKTETDKQIQAIRLFEQGNAAYDKRNWKEAIALYTQSIDLDDNVAAYCNRGVAKQMLGDFVGATADFDIATQKAPDYAVAYVNRGNAKQESGDFAGAIAEYDIAIHKNLENVAAYYNRGVAKQMLGDLVGAIADFDIATQKDPNNAVAYYNRGSAKQMLGDFAGAIADFDIATQKDPNNVAAYYNRGSAKQMLGDLVGAIADFEIATQKDPNNAVTYCNKACAFALQNRPVEEVLVPLAEAIRLDEQQNPNIVSKLKTFAQMSEAFTAYRADPAFCTLVGLPPSE
jgi:tetratricopeptide (TPR) repeat protein